MSDDDHLGKACGCVPSRVFVAVVAVCLLLHGVLGIFSLMIDQLTEFQGAAPRCIEEGGHRCMQALSCYGNRDTTAHIRLVFVVLGGALFGCFGCRGILSPTSGALLAFGWYLFFLGGVLALVLLGDGLFVLVCDAYPTNMVDVGLEWPIPTWPVHLVVKHEVARFSWYPFERINTLTGLRLWLWYLGVALPSLALAVYAGRVAHMVSCLSNVGSAGLGANHSIGKWYENMKRQEHLRENLRGARERFAATWQDMTWDPEELAEAGGPLPEHTMWGPKPGRHRFWKDMARPKPSYGATSDLDEGTRGRLRHLANTPCPPLNVPLAYDPETKTWTPLETR